MGRFKLSRWSSVDTNHDAVKLDTKQKEIIMMTQQFENNRVKTLNGQKSDNLSKKGDNSFGTNLLRNRYSVSARVRHGPLSKMLSAPFSSSYVILLLLAFGYIACVFADPLSEDPKVKCNDSQYKCDCGIPQCIDKSLVKNGVKDCEDGSDEGQWDPSKCAIKNTTSEDIRFKRGALPDDPPRVISNGDATTQFFTGDRARTRPVGLLSTNLGAFVTSGTTTEYLTKILGTYIKGTYARVISTSSKVYHAVPTDAPDFATGAIRPTGFIASTVSTEVNGYATTLHTTDFYRTYIDGTYAQLVSSYSHVQYPTWFTEQIDPTAAPESFSSHIYPTKASDFHVSVSTSHHQILPQEVRGSFVNIGLQSKAVAEVGVVVSSSSSSSSKEQRDSNRLRALKPNSNSETELRVTGTHGKFVHTGTGPADETTYNVFTGSYVQNSKTFLFFFGNTVIDPSKSNEKLPQTIMVENGTSSNVLVDMTKNLRVIVPSKNNRMMVDGSLNGEHMDGVIVEIEGSEPGIEDGEEGITVGGASAKSTPSDPRIDMITVNLKNKGKGSSRVSTSSSSSSSSSSKNENDNEIPRARKVQDDQGKSSANLIRPSRTRTITLPTFTVGQPDVEDSPMDADLSTSTAASNKVVVVNVEASSTKSKARGSAPVFQKPTTERIQKTTERIQSYSRNSQNSYTPTYKNSKLPNRNHRAFSGFDVMAAKFNDIDSDLQSAASTGRATVTYVGFADFTTTVGNTVIVFMPRTKMIEDLSVHATATRVDMQSPRVEPTRFVYHHSDDDDEETTTQRRPFDDDDEEDFGSGRPRGKKVGISASVSVSSSTTPRNEEDSETTTEISPSEAVREVSGRQTLILGNKRFSSSGSRFSSEFKPIATPALRPSLASKFRPSLSSSSASPSSSSSSNDRRNSLFSISNRPRYTPKLSKTSEAVVVSSSPVVTKPSSQSGVYQVASTAVFQTDKVNPTGLVTSIDGTVIRDKTTYLFTSLVYGTFIGSSYAQVIKSTSRVLPIKATASSGPSIIRPTPIARFPKPSHSRGFFNDDIITTESPTTAEPDEEGETTIRPLDRMEVSVSSTTERSQSREDDEVPTTTSKTNTEEDDSYYEDYTTTTERDFEKENEIERKRKVAGQAKDQIIVDKDDTLEATPTSHPDEDQTIYVTRTQPTTVYRTYTYYTTYFIPKEDSTLTSVTSREVTSTSVGLARKTYTSIKPTSTEDSAAEVTETVDDKEKSRGKYRPSSSSNKGKIRPSGAQVIYKTFYTTFTYLTTFFTGQASSVKSREEIVSNVVTLTSSIGSSATTSVKIRPTASAALRSKLYKTVSPRLSSSQQGGPSDNVGASSPGLSRFSSVRRHKLSSKIVSVPPSPTFEVKSASRGASKIMEPVTINRTFYTTFTYFTTLFNGDETSIQSRTEVVTNIVPTVTRTAIVPSATASPTDPSDEYEEEEYEEDTEAPETIEKEKFASSTAFRMSNKNKQKETTYYSTYTYLTTSLGQDGSSQVRSSLKTFTNVVVGDKTIRSGMVGTIEPTKLTGRSAGKGAKKTARPFVNDDDDDDLNEVGSHVSETSETTLKDDEEGATTVDPHQNDYYELEGSETPITTDRSIFDEELDRKKPSKSDKRKNKDDDEENGLDATPVLKTYFTTFTFYTTYYQDGSSTVASRLETKTQVVSDTAIEEDDEVEPTVSVKEALLSTPVEPITYFTTFTYFTSSTIDGSTIVNSREETVTNVVTPEADGAQSLRTVTPTGKALRASENEVVPTASSEFELTTYFTTFTYYTTSYIGESTVVNSRLETVTNVVTGTVDPTDAVSSVFPTKPSARAIGTSAPGIQQISSGGDKDEYQDYDLQTGLLSTIVSSEVVDRTTTVYSTDVFGTYIDGIYAQVLESTSKVINPTVIAETRFLPEATETVTGVVSVNEGKTVDAEGLATTFYGTTAYGTVIDGTYAQLIESTSSVKRKPGATRELDATEQQKTGLVRIIDGTNVDGDHTTYYTSSIVGTFIDGQYAQVIESTSRYVISPTKSDGITTVSPTKGVEIEGSITERPGEDDGEGTTTEKNSEQEEEEQPETFKRPGVLPGKRPSFGKNRNSSRLSYKSSSKSATPSITPFASRSRPSGFVPRGRKTQSSISPTKTDSSASSSPTSTSARGFQSRRRFQRPGESSSSGGSSSSSSDTTTPTTATPRLPFSRGNSRFQRPSPGGGSRFTSSKSEIQPTSASSSGSSSPGSRGRSTFGPRGSSAAGARGRVTSSGFSRGTSYPGSSSAGGFRAGVSSSRFLPGRGRATASINPSAATSVTTVKPTQTLNPDEEEYEVEYEYESSQQPSSTTTTTENPRSTSNRIGGGNRFRLNPRLSTPISTSGTTSRPSTTRNLPFLRRQNFSKPTLPTRGTTPSSSSSETSPTSATAGDNHGDEYEEIEVEEYEEEEKPSSTTSTTRPNRPGLLGRRPGSGGLSSLTSRPSSRSPQTTTTTSRARSTTETPQARSTTKRIYTPRPRPAGFPKPIGVTKSTTTTTEKPDSTLEEYYEEGDFEYEESRHLPGNVTIDQASGGSELIETVLKPDGETVVEFEESAPDSPSGLSSLDGSQVSAIAPAQDSKDTVDALLSYAAGSPYQSIPGQQEADTGSVGGLRRRRRQANHRQVFDYYSSYNPYQYNYNSQQFGARSARGTLRSNFSPSPSVRRSGNSFGSSSSSNSNTYQQSNSRGGPTYSNSDYDYVEYYDEPAPAPTTAAPARSAPSTRLRGRIQPTPTSSRRTPFTLTHTDNSNTNNNNNPSSSSSTTNTRPSSSTRSRTSSYNSRPSTSSSSRPTSSSSTTNSRTFIPRRSSSRYSRPTEPPTTTSRSNRFRSRYNSRDSVTTAAPSYTRSRFGSQLTRGRGTSSTTNSLTRSNSNVEIPFEASTITVTHFIPQETTIPIVNGRSTDYKTVLTPSPSIEVLSPFQYTQIEYLGKPVLVKNDEVTSTVGPGITEVTQFLIRESPTSTVTFTPTTIRGRKTSFSHILPSTVYSVEPVVSTISNPLGPLLNNNPNDPNQLTNLLLNQLLGLNPNLLGLQGQLMANLLNNNQNNLEPATPITQYSTITTSYTTTVTDYTSTVIPITLHGKAIKTTIVESSTKVISAVEYITSSTVITPSPPPQLIQPTQQQPPPAALLQNLLQSQLLQQQLLQQQQQPIVPTQPPQLLLPQVQPTQQVPLLQQLQQLQKQQQLLQQTQQPELPQKDIPKLEPEPIKNEKLVVVKEEQKLEVTNTPAAPIVEPTKSDGVPPGSSVITVYVSDEDEGGGGDIIGGSVEVGRGEVVRSFQSLDDDEGESVVPEQRVSGGRLFIQNGRDFYTKVMSNGVGVIVRGHKTAHIGFEKTPILPHRVSNRPITLPPHTVSRQFHLIESPGRPLNNAISHLLHSIVRSATPDMVTKTMLTTLTYFTTVLRHSNTIVKSREETISNVLTQKYRPSIEYTPSVKAEPSSLPPDLLASFTGSSSYFTDTLTTTYVYLNTFTVDTVPVILTSRETVTNVVTLPIYMSPTLVDLMVTGSRVFETETYFQTYTFSKTMLLSDAASEVLTTKEVITQVVITEALAPPRSQGPMNTPILQTGHMSMDEITKTYFTTFNHLFTELDDNGQLIIRSSTSVKTEIVTEKVAAIDSSETIEPDPTLLKIKMTAQPTFTGFFEPSPSLERSSHITMRSPSTLIPMKSPEFQDPISVMTIKPSITIEMMEPSTLEPVMIYATKTYYTTFTFFTTVLADGSRTKASVHSRTEIVSKVVTEALSTSFDAYYLNELKSSYLSKHSTMIDITSSVREVTPAKTLEATERPGTLVTQSFSHPHWPKDNDELAVEVDGTTVNSIDGVEVPADKENPVQAEIQVSSASSEEHFDEVKDEISHIVNVLTDQAQGSEESPTSALSPSPTQQPIYSTVQIISPGSILTASETVGVSGVGYVEQLHFEHPAAAVLSDELHDFAIGFEDSNSVLPVTHLPTPPLEQITTSPIQPLTTAKPKTKRPFNPFTTGLDNLFPDIGPPPQKSTIIDLPSDMHEYSYEDNKDDYSSMLMAGPHSTSILAKRTGTMVLEPVSPTYKNPSDHLLNLVSSLADGHWVDYEKEDAEEDIPPPNIYNIYTTFDSFYVPTTLLAPVPIKSPSVILKLGTVSRVKTPGLATITRLNSTVNKNNEDGGDMKIHGLADDDLLDGSGSGSGETPIYVEEVLQNDGSGSGSGYIEAETDYREEDHTNNPDGEEVEEGDVEGFTKMTESPIPPFPPKTRYTTSRRPDKKKKTKRPIYGVEIASNEQDQSGETKVYSLKVPSLDLGAGVDSVSDESDNKNSEQENDDESESEEKPNDDLKKPKPSKSSITFPVMGPVVHHHPGPGTSSGGSAPQSKFDWKPLLKLGAIGLGGLGASSLTKLSPWFNSMAGSLMKGSIIPLARNDSSSSQSGGNGNGRPMYHRPPPPKSDERDRPALVQHSEPIYIPVNGGGEEIDDPRIPRRPIVSHAKDPNSRPVSLERDRDRYPPGRGHPSSPYRDIGSDGNYPQKNNYNNFKPPNDRLPNIYSLSELNLHKNGEYILNDPNLRVINGPPLDVHHHSASDLPEGKTEFILRPIQNILNGKPAYEGSPKPGPVIPLRPPAPPPYRSSAENRPPFRQNNDQRPQPPEYIDINDIPDLPPRKQVQEIPILRPVPPTEGIILPHRIRGEHGGNQRHPTNTELLLNALKRPFMPKPLHPFRQSEEILNMKPPGPFQSGSGMGHYSGESGRHPPPNLPMQPAIHMSPPEMNPFPPTPPPQSSNQNHQHQMHHHHHQLDAEASEENLFKDIFGIRPANNNNNNNNNNDYQNNYGNDNRKPEISFHPHNAGEGPFRPLSNENRAPQYPASNIPVPHPTGIAGQPSNQFGLNEDDLSREESSENPFKNEFTKMNPTKKPGWPALDSNAPMSYSYFEDQSHIKRPEVQQVENEIATSNLPSFPPEDIMPQQPPPLAFTPPTPHIPPHRQRPSTVYIIQQEEMEPPTTTTTTTTYAPPTEQDVGESVMGGDARVTTEYPKLIIKEIPTRPVAPYYRRYTTTATTPAAATNQSSTNRATIAKLFIRRFSTTTTPSTLTSGETTTPTPPRFVTWRTRLRPTYVSTTTAAPIQRRNQTTKGDPTDTLIDSWLVSPTVNDLQDFLNDFKSKYTNSSTSNSSNVESNVYLPHKFSSSSTSTTQGPQNSIQNDDDLEESSEYEDDDELLEDELSIGAASSERNSTSTVLHPNHHPVHKPPIDADHYFSTGQGDFAQYYSGSEDRDTIIDPVNQQIIKSPFDSSADRRRNLTALINRYRSTTNRPVFRPVHFRNFTLHTVGNNNNDNVAGSSNNGDTLTISLPNDAFSSSTPSENEITGLPGPTTYRPRFDVTFHSKMGTTSEEPQNPTTFRGDILRPTTFRPGPEDLPPINNRLRPDPTKDLISNTVSRPPTTRRPAPQSGIASFYDDEESMGQLKIKNQEIHKLPTHTKKPNTIVHDILDTMSDEDLGSAEKSKLLVSASSVKSSSEKTTTTPAPVTNKDEQNKKGDDYDGDAELYSEEYDSVYEEDAYLEIPPAIPTKNNQEFAPAAPSNMKNSAEGKQNNQFVNVHGTPPPPHSRRPGPLEMLTNFFRRPQHPRPPPPNHPMAGGPGRLPFVPNNSREPTRTMLPPPLEKRPELEFQANAFNPHIKVIPLNPNADKNDNNQNKLNDPIVLVPKEFTTDNPSFVTTTLSPNRESGEKTTLNPSVINFEDGKVKNDQATQDSNTVTVNPNSGSNNNGIRESTYVEESEYYEDDEMEEDDKNNVIPPEEDNSPHYTGPPIKFQPTNPPPTAKPQLENVRPITIGGHVFNNGNLFRPPAANQRRPLPPPLGRPLPPLLNRPNIFNSPTLNNMQHVPPLIQNDPIPPRTEMEPPPIDSNRLKAPILELPSGGPIRYRPLNNNGYRPNHFRPDEEKPDTKASKTVHTIATVDELNKIIATNTFTAIIPTRNGQNDEEIQATSTRETSTQSNIEPSEVHLEGSESSVGIPHKSSVTNIKMTSIIKYTGGRLETTEIGGGTITTATRGINIFPTRASTTQSIMTTTTSTNTRLNILNRRPPPIVRQSTTSSTTSTESSSSSSSSKSDSNPSSVRVSVTMESTVSSNEAAADSSAQSVNRRPFIPTRGPTTRNTNYPWLRKTTSATSLESLPTSAPTTTSKTVSSSERSTSFPARGRLPIGNPTTEPTSKESHGFSTTLRHAPSIFNISRGGSSRPDILRRTSTTTPRASIPATKISSSSSSKESSRVSMEISSKVSSSSTESKERPTYIFPPRSSTFRPPFRRPTLSFVSPSSPSLPKSREKFTTALINKVSTTSGTPSPTTKNPTVFSGILTSRNFTTSTTGNGNDNSAMNNSTTSIPMSESEEYEYTDEEYEDEDFELDGGKSENVSKRPKVTSIETKKETNSQNNNGRTVTTSSSMSVSTSMSIGNDTQVITVSSSEISPTRVNNNSSNRANRPKGILNTMVLRGGITKVPDLPAVTKYITHSETETKTLTETETTVVVTAGTPYTHTIMITKTLPPQTLISTIVGSVTLVNSIDVKPTTVRSTIFAQPTKEVYSFVDTSEDLDSRDDSNRVEDTHTNIRHNTNVHSGNNNHHHHPNNNNNKVLQGGVLTGGGSRPYRPTSSKGQTPPPNHIPKHEIPTTTKEPKSGRTKSVSYDLGCSANCTNHGNQACRPYANGTKYKCDCKPGYARLKRKFPCRPTYTYELSLAINQMDGMSFDFKDLQNSGTSGYHSFITVSKEAIDKAFLSTDIKRQFQGSEIMKLRPLNAMNERTKTSEPKVYVDFLVQLTANVTEDRIRNHLIRTLKSSNFSVGRTGISSTKNMSDFGARDFNECHFSEFNDCSPNAECINLRGSFSCRCRAGYRDKSPKKHKPGRDCLEMQGCPECNYKGHCRINAYGEPFCECFRWFGGSKCHINLKILLFAIMGVVAILFIFVLLCSVLVCRRTKIHRERPGSGRFMRYRSPTSQATLDRAAIMNDSASSDGRQSPPRVHMNMHGHSFTPDSLVVEGDSKQPNSGGMRGDSLLGSGPDNVHLMNFSLRNVIMDQDRSLTVVIPRAKIRPPSRPPSIHATLGPDPNADLAANERKLINYLDHSPYPPAPYPPPKLQPPTSSSRQSTIKRHDSRQFRKLSLQEQRKISTGALVSSGTEVSARGGMRRRSIGPEPEPTYSGYDKSFSDLRSITDTMRSPAQQHLFSTDTSRTSCYSHTCKPPSYCAYSESAGHTMGDKDGASTVYTTQGKLFRMAPDDTDSTASSH